MNFLKCFRKLKEKIAKYKYRAPDPDQNQNQAQHSDEDQAPDFTAASTAASNNVGFAPGSTYPAPTVIHYGLRTPPITIFSNPKPHAQFTNYENRAPDLAAQIPVAATKKPEITRTLPNPKSDTISPFYYQDQSPAPKAFVIKKRNSKRISPHSTTGPITIIGSLRPKPLNHSRHGLSQSLVVKSAGFKASGLVVVCGDREDQSTGEPDDEDDRSNEEEEKEEGKEEEEEETDNQETELSVEIENGNRPLPLSVLDNLAEDCTGIEDAQDHQGTTDQTVSPKLLDAQFTPPGLSHWIPAAPTQAPKPKVECLKWKPKHTAAGLLRDEERISAFEKIPAAYLQPLRTSSVLSEYFNTSQRKQSQEQESQSQATLLNASKISIITDFETDPNNFKSFPEGFSSPRAMLQEADARRNFAGERDIWRRHANLIGVEPKISVMNRSSPQVPAMVPQGPVAIPSAAIPIHIGGGVAGEFPRRSAPIRIPRRRTCAYYVAYPTPLPTIPASPRETLVGIEPEPKFNNQGNRRNRRNRPRMFKSAVRKVFNKPNQA